MTATVPRQRRLPPPEPGPDGTMKPYQPGLAAALDSYQEAVVRLDGMDIVTTELVRLRCARTHDCVT
jgi:hypothetical protein